MHAFTHLLKAGGLQKCMSIHRQSCSWNCDGCIEHKCCLLGKDNFGATVTLAEFDFAWIQYVMQRRIRPARKAGVYSQVYS